MKAELYLYEIDVFLKLKTGIIKYIAIWDGGNESLNEKGRSKNKKVRWMQEILWKRIDCIFWLRGKLKKISVLCVHG